ncbi:hypothetical protein CMI38_02960 [Candidatus Pacearchaeota archaeon]|jgi:hypothetical protein|nr:hypothetical protein [Candidatus Pacearchaeota archaeon]|tara:strand:- start:114 stop:1073 length:960 start_codon:yes stop_codon:yes gene_type:complete
MDEIIFSDANARGIWSSEGFEWLKKFPQEQGVFVKNCVDSVRKFSEGNYKDHFKNCGLYAVGSSVEGNEYSDVDLVLVGLDFRSVIEYDKVFLMDPETLINEGVVVEPYKFEVLSEKDGESSLLRPVSDANSSDMMGQFMFHGIEHNGVKYDYDADRHSWIALNLDSFCKRRGKTSDLVDKLGESIQKFTGNPVGPSEDPFETYFHGDSYFLTTRFPVLPLDLRSGSNIFNYDGVELPFAPVDFIIHAENLHASSWKEHQENYGMPYVKLVEWPLAYVDIGNRPKLTELPQPLFIDENGKNRVKWHTYFDYLKEPPINV